MRKLLNSLYVTSPDAYMNLDGMNIVVKVGGEERIRVPLINLESIVSFGHAGATPALMHACAENNIGLSFLSENGKFLARIGGRVRGNVLLRRMQYRAADNADFCLSINSVIVAGKIENSRKVIERHLRDYPDKEYTEKLKRVSSLLKASKVESYRAKDDFELRGIEGDAAKNYFSAFDNLILNEDEKFRFLGRSRRPPKDIINAMLSFVYTILAHDVESALESVGLDPYVGFFHKDRPGRASLALDMMEELRAYLGDRLVLSLVNRGQISSKDFMDNNPNGVIMNADARKNVLSFWQKRKNETIRHPFLDENIKIGLIPYAQAMLLAKHIRGELDAYPVFLIS